MAREATLAQLASAWQDASQEGVLVVTGAGISLASGIPTYRGTDNKAVWKENPEEMGTFRYFRRRPVRSWLWYAEKFAPFMESEPNTGHLALAQLEAWHKEQGGDFLLVTQNVDLLHERAGSESMVKIHGTLDRFRCSKHLCRLGTPKGSIPADEVDLESFLANPNDSTLPRCPECGELIRMHVLWFDEYYTGHEDYQFARVIEEAQKMSLLVFVGTSFSVGITERLLSIAWQQQVPVFSINPGIADGYGGGNIQHILGKSEELLPQLLQTLSSP